MGLSKNQNIVATSVESDETAHDEPSHQNLHCLQKRTKHCFDLQGLKRLKEIILMVR